MYKYCYFFLMSINRPTSLHLMFICMISCLINCITCMAYWIIKTVIFSCFHSSVKISERLFNQSLLHELLCFFSAFIQTVYCTNIVFASLTTQKRRANSIKLILFYYSTFVFHKSSSLIPFYLSGYDKCIRMHSVGCYACTECYSLILIN